MVTLINDLFIRVYFFKMFPDKIRADQSAYQVPIKDILKTLKKMLHLCALTTIRYYPEFKDYYERKKQEGKHSMCILNAIRNKIVLRAVAVVNNKKAYVENYAKAA